MRPAGVAAFARRTDDRTAIYSHEQRRNAQLGPEEEAQLRADPAAWEYFAAQPPSYRRAAAHWVMSAKRAQTRRRRLAQLVADSAQGRAVPPLVGRR